MALTKGSLGKENSDFPGETVEKTSDGVGSDGIDGMTAHDRTALTRRILLKLDFRYFHLAHFPRD